MLTDLKKEIKYRTSRSGGAGGQNVNKVSTKVELLFDVDASQVLTQRRKKIIKEKLANKINQEGILCLKCEETRSQLSNKEIVFERFIQLIQKALTPVKKRKKTRPTIASEKKRLENKKKQAQKKSDRNFKGE